MLKMKKYRYTYIYGNAIEKEIFADTIIEIYEQLKNSNIIKNNNENIRELTEKELEIAIVHLNKKSYFQIFEKWNGEKYL